MKRAAYGVCVLLIGAGCMGPTDSSTQTRRSQLIDAEEEYSRFAEFTGEGELGSSVAVERDMFLVGAPELDAGRGGAFVYIRIGKRGWRMQATLSPEDGSSAQNFGAVVALDGDSALVSAPGEAIGEGRVQAYRATGSGWEAVDTLSEAETQQFGRSLAFHDGIAAVGSLADGTTGKVSIFRLEVTGRWHRLGELLGATREFGRSVAISDGRIAVADREDGVGIVRLFEQSGDDWEESSLLAGRPGEEFGEALAFDGDDLLVGAPGEDASVYFFTRGIEGWAQSERLRAPGDNMASGFGASVAIAGDRAVVGSSLEARLYKRVGDAKWDLEQVLGSEGDTADRRNVAIWEDGRELVVARPGEGVVEQFGYNRRPVAESYRFEIAEDSWLEFEVAAEDPDGDSLEYSLDSLPLLGWLHGKAPRLTYQPRTNFAGEVSFEYLAEDPGGLFAQGDVTISLGQVNDPPEARRTIAEVARGESVDITLRGWDPEGDALAYEVVSQPRSGVVFGSPPFVTYIPHSGFTGWDSFQFVAKDWQHESRRGLVEVHVLGDPDDPADSIAAPTSSGPDRDDLTPLGSPSPSCSSVGGAAGGAQIWLLIGAGVIYRLRRRR